MHKLLFCGMQIYCIVFCLFVYCNAGSLNQPKRVGNNQQRLFPFPRVGRGGENTWDYGFGSPKQREGKITLFAFPRVGRSEMGDMSDDMLNENDPKKMNSRLWFGPRLGRVQKRDIFLYGAPNEHPKAFYIPIGSQDSRQVHYTPRLGRESDEDSIEGDD